VGLFYNAPEPTWDTQNKENTQQNTEKTGGNIPWKQHTHKDIIYQFTTTN